MNKDENKNTEIGNEPGFAEAPWGGNLRTVAQVLEEERAECDARRAAFLARGGTVDGDDDPGVFTVGSDPRGRRIYLPDETFFYEDEDGGLDERQAELIRNDPGLSDYREFLPEVREAAKAAQGGQAPSQIAPDGHDPDDYSFVYGEVVSEPDLIGQDAVVGETEVERARAATRNREDARRIREGMLRDGRTLEEVDVLMPEDGSRVREYVAGGGDDPRPNILVEKGNMTDALRTLTPTLGRSHTIFNKDGRLVFIGHRPDNKMSFVEAWEKQERWSPATVPYIATARASNVKRAIEKLFILLCEKFDKKGNSIFQRSDCPHDLAIRLLEANGEGWGPLPVLDAIVMMPVMFADGTIFGEQGYTERYRLYIDHGSNKFRVPDGPISKDDARRALDRVIVRIASFDLGGDGSQPSFDRSGVLAYFLTCAARYAFEVCPMFLSNSPNIGAGKTILAVLGAILMTGEYPSLWGFGHNQEEFEKTLKSMALANNPVSVIDNVNRQNVNSEVLAMITTNSKVAIRGFGTLGKETVSVTSVICMTGVGVSVHRDLSRRTIAWDILPTVENPSAREFDVEPVLAFQKDRADVLFDLWTVLAGWRQSGQRAAHVGARLLGGFEAWSDMVSGALVWLGEPDVVERVRETMKSSEENADLRRLLEAIHRAFGREDWTVRQLIQKAAESDERENAIGGSDGVRRRHQDLYEVMQDFFRKPDNPKLVSGELGKVKDKIVGSFKLKKMQGLTDGMARFAVVQV